jgi:hypothetical protein
MNDPYVNEALIDQFERVLLMFREAADAFSEEEWRSGDSDYQRPAGLALHLVETIHFYTSNVPVNEFEWGGPFKVDWEDKDSEKLPSSKQVLVYLDNIWSDAREWMTSCDLSSKEDLYPGTGKTLLSKMGYLLRHCQHHTAELSLELTRRGLPAPEWR